MTLSTAIKEEGRTINSGSDSTSSMDVVKKGKNVIDELFLFAFEGISSDVRAGGRPFTRPAAVVALLAVFLTFSGTASALDPRKSLTQYIQQSWTSDQNLPQNSVQAILQTRDGFIWFGTQEGLVRFDGMRMQIYDRRNAEGMSSKYILKLIEDSRGVVWMGTGGGGLIKYQDGIFQSFTTQDGLSSNYVTAICEGRGGELWVGTNGGGLNVFKNGKFTRFAEGEKLPSNAIRALLEGRDGALWVGTEGGLLRIRDGTFSVIDHKNGLPNNTVMSLLEDRNGALWIGTYGGGLCRIQDGVFTTYSTKKGLSHDFVTSLLEDRDGALWIGTYGGGLDRFMNGVFTAVSTKEGFPNDFVIALLEDREGSLWAGTYGSGVTQLRDPKFNTYSTREGLSANDIRSIFEDRDGTVWVGTYGGGLNRIKDRTITVFTTGDGLPNMNIRSVRGDREGNIWVGTFGGGLSLWRDGKFRTFTTANGLPNNFVMALEEDLNGDLWIGTNGGLVRRPRGGSTSFFRIEGLLSQVIRGICAGRDGSVWIGSYSGLTRFKDGKVTNYNTADGLPGNLVLSLYEDRDGVLWIGTYGNGLSRLENGKFHNFSYKEGLFDDVVYRILEDDFGTLWMSCNRGIYSVRKSELDECARGTRTSLVCSVYDKSDGMKSSECNGGSQPAGWKAGDGKLWFPSLGGIVVIDPSDLKFNNSQPPVLIGQVVVDGRQVDADTAALIASGKKKFEFHYTALTFLVPEKVRFRFKLEGFDEDWVEAGTRRTAYYTNIPPRRYRFLVTACNSDGVWNKKGAVFEFYLRPRFYQTLWFLGFLGISSFVGVWGGVRLRLSRHRARERHLTQVVNEKTRDLNDVMKILERTNGDLERANLELERLSLTDRLTDLPNRRRFEKTLEDEWSRCRRQGQPLSFLLADIDNFKAFNDTFGHQKGDECLQKVAVVLKGSVYRPADLPARYGGEEFVVILPNTDSKGACLVAERIRSELEMLGIPNPGSHSGPILTISVGVTTMIPDKSSLPEFLVGTADKALFQAKQEGRNRVVCLEA